MTPPEDRRRTRSDDPLVALHHQLAHARRDGGLDAIVVADESGMVVAGAGAWAVCEELAAYAPLLAAALVPAAVWDGPNPAGDSRIAELGTEVDVRPVDVNGQTVLLCARGGWMRTSAIERAIPGITRILKRAA